MGSESKKTKPKTDFEPIMNFSNQCTWKKLKNDSSAGANADYRVDNKTFSATTEPLSEIVWSPDKGFSLKCVDSSFTNKNTSLFRNVEPSSMVLALLQSVTCGSSTTTDKPIDDVFVEPLAVICTKSDDVDTPASDSVVIIPEYKACEEHDTGSDDNMEKMNSARGTPSLPNAQKENLMNQWEKNICAQANIETPKISEIMENKSSTISDQANQIPVGKLLLQADESKPSMEQNPSPKKHCKEGMDSGVGNQLVKIEDGSNVRLSKEGNERHLSCESYNSTQLFLPSRKRCKQEVIIGSKKFKKQIQETSYSKSYVKRDSSFMNLIPNKMKGYSQSSQYEENSSALAHENLDRRLLWPDQKRLTCNKDENPGFKFNFQSNVYCQSFENVGTRMCHQVGEASNDFEQGKEVHEIDATPISYCAENNKRQYLHSNKFEVSKRGHDVILSNHSYCSMLPHHHKQISHLNNCKVEETRNFFADIQLHSEAKELQNCCINKEAYTSLKDEKGNSDHTSKNKFNNVTPFPRLRDSKPMVSIFAKRLGAIKQCQHIE